MVQSVNAALAEDYLTCSNCGNTNPINDSFTGDVVCRGCGLVLESRIIDLGAEWRAFSLEDTERRARVGAPATFTIHDKGLSTMIDWRDQDAFGKKLTPARRAEAYRLRKWNTRMRVHSSIDRNLAFAMSEMDRLASQMGLQRTIRENSAILYRKAIEKNLIRGRSIEAMMAASIYTACRMNMIPRTLDELADNSRIGKRELGRCFRLIVRELHLRIPVLTAGEFIARYCNDLSLPVIVEQRAKNILLKAARWGITAGKDPTGLAAASIYIASILSDERRTQRDISAVANITEVTVRNRYKELITVLKIPITIQNTPLGSIPQRGARYQQKINESGRV
jgi:transcription initiation factor TFIIB